MVVIAGHDLGLGAVGEEHATDNVHLPQRHRLVALPAQVAVPGPLPGGWLDQAVADQDPVDAHPRRDRDHAQAAELVGDPGRTPLRVLTAGLADSRLDLVRGLMRAGIRPSRPVSEGTETALLITPDPRMHALPRYPEPLAYLRDAGPCPDLEDSPVTLLDNRRLHQCQSRPPAHPLPANDE